MVILEASKDKSWEVVIYFDGIDNYGCKNFDFERKSIYLLHSCRLRNNLVDWLNFDDCSRDSYADCNLYSEES